MYKFYFFKPVIFFIIMQPVEIIYVVGVVVGLLVLFMLFVQTGVIVINNGTQVDKANFIIYFLPLFLCCGL